MFQSSRIASGNPCRQASNAFSPSSASRIWKSSPSRIRLATLRMTLESSTTKHVFILASVSSCPIEGGFHLGALSFLLSRHLRRRDFQDTIDIEHDHELAIETMYAAGKLGHARIEIDRIVLAAVIRQRQHLADLIDQQAVRFAAQ